MTFEELRKRILATSGKTRQDVSEDDMARAIKKLRVLGGGFIIIPVGKSRLVQSVPGELNLDHTAVLQKAEVCRREGGRWRGACIPVFQNILFELKTGRFQAEGIL